MFLSEMKVGEEEGDSGKVEVAGCPQTLQLLLQLIALDVGRFLLGGKKRQAAEVFLLRSLMLPLLVPLVSFRLNEVCNLIDSCRSRVRRGGGRMEAAEQGGGRKREGEEEGGKKWRKKERGRCLLVGRRGSQRYTSSNVQQFRIISPNPLCLQLTD